MEPTPISKLFCNHESALLGSYINQRVIIAKKSKTNIYLSTKLIESKMDQRGIEPRTSPMRRVHYTTKPLARVLTKQTEFAHEMN